MQIVLQLKLMLSNGVSPNICIYICLEALLLGGPNF